MTLLTQNTIDAISSIEGPNLRWLKLRERLEVELSHRELSSEGNTDSELLEFATILADQAQSELEINLEPPSIGNILDDFAIFRAQVSSLAMSIGKKAAEEKQKQFVLLADDTADAIRAQIALLRAMVAQSEFATQQKTRLNELLDELEAQIETKELSYNSFYKPLGIITAIVVGTTTFLADAPAAIATITNLVGIQDLANQEHRDTNRISTDAAVPLLPPPPKSLPAP